MPLSILRLVDTLPPKVCKGIDACWGVNHDRMVDQEQCSAVLLSFLKHFGTLSLIAHHDLDPPSASSVMLLLHHLACADAGCSMRFVVKVHSG